MLCIPLWKMLLLQSAMSGLQHCPPMNKCCCVHLWLDFNRHHLAGHGAEEEAGPGHLPHGRRGARRQPRQACHPLLMLMLHRCRRNLVPQSHRQRWRSAANASDGTACWPCMRTVGWFMAPASVTHAQCWPCCVTLRGDVRCAGSQVRGHRGQPHRAARSARRRHAVRPCSLSVAASARSNGYTVLVVQGRKAFPRAMATLAKSWLTDCMRLRPSTLASIGHSHVHLCAQRLHQAC